MRMKMEMSLADLELCPWLHLDRGAKNKEEWEEWLSLRTLLEWSGINYRDRQKIFPISLLVLSISIAQKSARKVGS